MTRSEFIRMFLLGGAGATMAAAQAKAAPVAPPQRLRYLYSGNINGTMYHSAPDVFHRMRHNDLLTLQLEPTNRHDHRAIEVLWQGHKLGYVPRTDNKVLYNLLRDDTPVVARLKKVEDGPWHELENPYSALRMRVWMQQGPAGTEPPLIPIHAPGTPHMGAQATAPAAPVWTDDLLRLRAERQHHMDKMLMHMPCTLQPDGTMTCNGWQLKHAELEPNGSYTLLVASPSGTEHYLCMYGKGRKRFVELPDLDAEVYHARPLTKQLNALPPHAQDSLVQCLRQDLWQPLVDLERAMAHHARQALQGAQAEADAISAVLQANITRPAQQAHTALQQGARHAWLNNPVATEAKGINELLSSIRHHYGQMVRWWVG